jgi:AmiR/NasT family two-component response regulator
VSLSPEEAAAERIKDLGHALARAVEHVEHLERVVDSRDLIEQAKGILMERDDIIAEDAFAELVRRSKYLNVKLGEIAERVSSEPGRRNTDTSGSGD